MMARVQLRAVQGLGRTLAIAVGLLASVALPVAAQPEGFGFGLPAGPGDAAGLVKLSGRFELYEDGSGGRILITAEIAEGWHIYSVTQGAGALPTTIRLGETDLVKLTGSFLPDQPPERKKQSVGKETHVIEVHRGTVTWSAPFVFTQQVDDPKSIRIPVVVDGQVCTADTCQVFDGQVEAAFGGMATRASASTSFRPPQAHGKFTGGVSGTIQGTNVTLTWKLTATPDEKWHIYAAGLKEPGQTSSPTAFYFELPEGWSATEPVASSEPVAEEMGIPGEKVTYYHEKPVTWTITLRGPRSSLERQPVLRAWVGYQFCWDRGCDPDRVMTVSADLTELLKSGKGEAPFTFAPAKMSYDRLTETIRSSTQQTAKVASSSALSNYPLGWVLVIAMLGGFLLNFMPCVLPVIGLKIMAFVEQAGASRRKIFLLNFWYGVGMLVVFLAFALLLSARQLGLREDDFGWGQQSQYPPYVIAMAAVIFVMALSYLGVWEIPVPGFVGTSKLAQYSEQHEGYLAAVLKGIITTLVAIPCTAPALGTALAYCYSQPPKVIFTVFVAMWLGMAFPYLLIGIFPRLISFLPKPGLWMETFKEFLGFLLLGTVVFFLSFLEETLVVPTVGFLVALWMACWIIGKIPITAPPGRKALLRTTALLVAVLGGYFAYGFRGESEHELAWEPFSPAKLESKLKEGHVVLVDFTADW